jgi:hypothetical protein
VDWELRRRGNRDRGGWKSIEEGSTGGPFLGFLVVGGDYQLAEV